MPESLVHTLRFAHWFALAPDAQRVAAEDVARRVGFSFIGLEPTALGSVASFVDPVLGATFRLVPGGRFVMGFSSEEHARLTRLIPSSDEDPDDLRSILDDSTWLPAHEVDVPPFLIAAAPLDDAALAKLLGRDDALSSSQCVEPSFVPYIDTALAARGLRHPSEAEWEYVARGGTRALFPGGVDAIPEEPGWPMTGFGATQMGELPELCADGVHPSYAGAPADARPWAGEGRFTRGGSAMFWPWQGPNWSLSLCAARCALDPENDYFVAVRPVKSIFTDAEAYEAEAVRRRSADPTVEMLASARPPAGMSAPPPIAPPTPAPRLTGFEDLPSTVLSTMYDKPVFDLVELVTNGLTDERATAMLRDARKRRVEPGFYAGSTPALVPVFLRLLADTRVPGRHELAVLLIDVILGDHAPKLPALDWRRIGFQAVDRSMLLLANAEPVLKSLLEDKDLRVRAGGAMLVATALHGSIGSQLLVEAYTRNADPVLRANLAVAIGIASRPLGKLAAGLPDADKPGTEDPLLGAALAIQHATVMGAETRPAVCDALVRALDAVVPKGAFFPWAHGDVLSLAADSLSSVGPRGVDALTTGLLERVADPTAPDRLRSASAEWLLDLHLPYRSGEPMTRAEAAALGSLQRTIVATLSADDPPAPLARYDKRGLSLDAGERRALIGA